MRRRKDKGVRNKNNLRDLKNREIKQDKKQEKEEQSQDFDNVDFWCQTQGMQRIIIFLDLEETEQGYQTLDILRVTPEIKLTNSFEKHMFKSYNKDKIVGKIRADNNRYISNKSSQIIPKIAKLL